jgi:hypothetical protein
MGVVVRSTNKGTKVKGVGEGEGVRLDVETRALVATGVGGRKCRVLFPGRDVGAKARERKRERKRGGR